MTSPPERLVTALADRYRIERELGAGGMATVYLAHDVRHERPVALKVLRPELAAIIGAERFLAEIKTTANLQHPHVLGLIDSGEVNGTAFYVMPLVRGESLRERITREQQLSIDDAVRIATQVSGALDYAHRQGIIHRDIKPENVLLHDEQALVADFGIALALSRPDEKKRMTETGMSLGTPQYMSPEQAMGERNLDARTDVYALGCVLYEMLTGEPPFSGPNAQAIVAKVMTIDPQPVSTLRRSVPANVAAAVMVALNKVPADRFPSAAAFASALANPQYVAPAAVVRRATRTGPSVGLGALGVIAAFTVLAAAAVFGWLRPAPVAQGIVAQFQILIPDSIAPNQFVLSHDGTRILWSTTAGAFERPIDSLGVRRIADPVVGLLRDVSPDGRNALLAGRGSVSLVPLTGGPARMLQTGRGGGMSIMSWNSDGYVYWTFDPPSDSSRGIARASERLDGVDTVVRYDGQPNPAGFAVLPGARSVVVSIEQNGTFELRVYDPSNASWRSLGQGGPLVQYVEPGYLVFTSGTNLLAAPWDARRLQFTQEPRRIAETSGGTVDRLAVRSGVLVYSAPDPAGATGLELRTRDGEPRSLFNIIDTVVFSQFVVSPDGRRIAATGYPRSQAGPQSAQHTRVYVYPLPSGPMQRLQSPTVDRMPDWIPPGGQLSFVRQTGDTAVLMRRSWDGTGTPTPVLARTGRGGNAIVATSWLPNGRQAVLQLPSAGGGQARGAAPGTAPRGGGQRGPGPGGPGAGGRGGPSDLWLFSTDQPDTLVPVVQTTFNESNPAVSPDGRLLAYTSNENERADVYIIRLNGTDRRLVSPGGGQQPRWSPGGRQLYFRLGDTLFSAGIATNPELSVTGIERVFTAPIAGGYAVLPGDSLFVTRRSGQGTARPLNVITNIGLHLDRTFARQQR